MTRCWTKIESHKFSYCTIIFLFVVSCLYLDPTVIWTAMYITNSNCDRTKHSTHCKSLALTELLHSPDTAVYRPSSALLPAKLLKWPETKSWIFHSFTSWWPFCYMNEYTSKLINWLTAVIWIIFTQYSEADFSFFFLHHSLEILRNNYITYVNSAMNILTLHK